jgi:hypothetical protein
MHAMFTQAGCAQKHLPFRRVTHVMRLPMAALYHTYHSCCLPACTKKQAGGRQLGELLLPQLFASRSPTSLLYKFKPA